MACKRVQTPKIIELHKKGEWKREGDPKGAQTNKSPSQSPSSHVVYGQEECNWHVVMTLLGGGKDLPWCVCVCVGF